METLNTQKIISPQTHKQYILLQCIGEGQYGKVVLAVDEHQNKYAMKLIPLTKITNRKIFELFQNEIQIMKNIQHPRILQLVESFEDQKFLYIVSQYCNGGDLQLFMENYKKENKGGLGEYMATNFIKQIIDGFQALIQEKIMHRDLKLANIMIHNNELIIVDFGFAKLNQSMAITKLGTPYYMAPELFSNQKDVQYSNKVDVWSLGVCYYELLFGIRPFNGQDKNEIYNQTMTRSGQKLRIPQDCKVNREVEILLKRMLEPNPDSRISFQELFSHPYFNERKSVSQYSTNKSQSQNSNQNQLINPFHRFNDNNQKKSYLTTPQQQQNSQATFLTSRETRTQHSSQNNSNTTNQFKQSHLQDNQSRQSTEQSDLEKQLHMPYYYYKNLLIFMMDSWSQLLQCRQNSEFDQIKVIYEALGQVILKKAYDIAVPITESINKSQNQFQLRDFEEFKNSKTFQNFKIFYNYLANFIKENYRQNKQEIQGQIKFDIGKIDGYSYKKSEDHLWDSTKQFLKFYQLRRQNFPQLQDSFIKLIMLMFFNHNILKKFPMNEFYNSRNWKIKLNQIQSSSTQQCENFLQQQITQQLIILKYFINIRLKIR